MLIPKEVKTALIEVEEVSLLKEDLSKALSDKVNILLIASKVSLLDNNVVSKIDVQIKVITEELDLNVQVVRRKKPTFSKSYLRLKHLECGALVLTDHAEELGRLYEISVYGFGLQVLVHPVLKVFWDLQGLQN